MIKWPCTSAKTLTQARTALSDPGTRTPMQDLSTIFALSSAPGRAGVSVIRISGSRAGPILDAMTSRRPEPRQAALRRIRHPQTGERLDDALVLFFEAPRSETGEDIAELQVHGSPAVVRAVLQALSGIEGCRLAEPGEFARRAFLNGRIDLTAAEGLADLVAAETDAQRRQALSQADGTFARTCDRWREALLEARALMEAAIDFSDEADVAVEATASARAIAARVRDEIQNKLQSASRGEIVRNGYRIVLAGAPNAGKSSLLNILAARDVAIVSAEPGTTRDVLEVDLDLAGFAVRISDTAGLREATGAVEQEGIRRALDRARSANLVLWLVDAANPVWAPPSVLQSEPAGLLVVLNKADLLSASTSLAAKADVVISASTGAGLPGLIATLASKVAAAAEGAIEGGLPTEIRHRNALEACAASLSSFLSEDDPRLELAAEDLRLAADALGRITGRIDAEEILGEIFGRFCIGK